VSVTDPYGPLGPAVISKDGRITLVNVQFSVPAQELPKDVYDQIVQATAPATDTGVRAAQAAVIDYSHQPPSARTSSACSPRWWCCSSPSACRGDGLAITTTVRSGGGASR
jgi:hypothetical protein